MIPLDIYRVEPTLLASLMIVPPGKAPLVTIGVVDTAEGKSQLPVFRLSGDRDQIKAQMVIQIDQLFETYEKAANKK